MKLFHALVLLPLYHNGRPHADDDDDDMMMMYTCGGGMV